MIVAASMLSMRRISVRLSLCFSCETFFLCCDHPKDIPAVTILCIRRSVHMCHSSCFSMSVCFPVQLRCLGFVCVCLAHWFSAWAMFFTVRP